MSRPDGASGGQATVVAEEATGSTVRAWGTALPEPRPELIAPGSALHTMLCDAVIGVYALPAFVVPLMHPATAAATAERDAAFRGERIGCGPFLLRIRDTMDLIGGIVYAGPEADHCADAVRDLHRDIRGELPSGEGYHAWTREIWTWNWAAIIDGLMATYGTFRGWPDDAFRDDAYRGLVEVGRRFGVRGLPADHATFRATWPTLQLEVSDPHTRAIASVRTALGGDGLAPPRMLRALPAPLWRAVTAPLRAAWRQSLQVALPVELRDAVGLAPTRADRALLAVQRAGWAAVPRLVTHRVGRVYFAQRRAGHPVWRTRYAPDALAARRRPGQLVGS